MFYPLIERRRETIAAVPKSPKPINDEAIAELASPVCGKTDDD